MGGSCESVVFLEEVSGSACKTDSCTGAFPKAVEVLYVSFPFHCVECCHMLKFSKIIDFIASSRIFLSETNLF